MNTIVTDHVSLTFLNSLKAGRGRLQRWALHLQGYTYTVCYKAGKTLTSADGLSRREYSTPPPAQEGVDDVSDDEAFLASIDTTVFDSSSREHRSPKTRERYSIDFVYDSIDTADTANNDTSSSGAQPSIAPLANNSDVPCAQRQCPDFTDIIEYLTSGLLPDTDSVARRIFAESEHYSILDGTLFHLHRPRTKRKDQVTPVVQQLCLPRTLREEVIKAYHDNNGHIGFDKLYETIRGK